MYSLHSVSATCSSSRPDLNYGLIVILDIAVLAVSIRQDQSPAGQLANSQELTRLLEDESEVHSGFHAVLKLAWGVMLNIIGDDSNQTHGQLQQYAAECT